MALHGKGKLLSGILISAASGLLGKPGTYQKSTGSWDLRYPLPKIEVCRFGPLFFGSGQFCVHKYSTSNMRGPMSGLNRNFTGKIFQ